MIRLAGKSRLTKAELEDIRENSGITNLQYEIVRLRYYDNKSQTAIAQELGMTQMQVSRFERKLLKELRDLYFKSE